MMLDPVKGLSLEVVKLALRKDGVAQVVLRINGLQTMLEVLDVPRYAHTRINIQASPG